MGLAHEVTVRWLMKSPDASLGLFVFLWFHLDQIPTAVLNSKRCDVRFRQVAIDQLLVIDEALISHIALVIPTDRYWPGEQIGKLHDWRCFFLHSKFVKRLFQLFGLERRV